MRKLTLILTLIYTKTLQAKPLLSTEGKIMPNEWIDSAMGHQ